MILYLSQATAYPIYDRLFKEGKIKSGYQAQKFNSNVVTGLSRFEEVVCLSVLPYDGVPVPRIDETHDGVRYVVVKNTVGRLHKPSNLLYLVKEGVKICRKNRVEHIVCDAYSLSPNYTAIFLSKLFGVPSVGIITDLPGLLGEKKTLSKSVSRMHGFDKYVLLTEAMNPLVNPKKKPYIIMEGICSNNVPRYIPAECREKTVVYSGSLWKDNAGIEYLVRGFLKAKLDGYRLLLYGTGELVPWIEEIGQKHSNVRYMGCVTNEEMVEIQTKASLLVNPRPSGEEFCKYSFPSKTIEYMLSGTPVLITRLPGIPAEYFGYCYTVDQESEEGMAAALRSCFQDDGRFAIGIAAREYVMTKKSCHVQAERLSRFFYAHQ